MLELRTCSAKCKEKDLVDEKFHIWCLMSFTNSEQTDIVGSLSVFENTILLDHHFQPALKASAEPRIYHWMKFCCGLRRREQLHAIIHVR